MAGSVAKELAILISGSDKASPALRQLQKELQGVKKASGDVGDVTDKSGKQVSAAMGGALGAISPVTLSMAGLGLAAGLAAKSVVTAGISYETAFAGVRKTVDATDEELQAMSGSIRQMAMEIPATREQIASVAEAAGQLGIKKDAILGFSKVMIDLGNTTNLSATEAATSLARLANITQMPQSEFDRLGSTVVALGNNLATTEQEIVSMGLRLAGAGHTVGMTEAQILSFAGALSSVGIEAEAGGTAFSRVMLNIQSAARKGGEELDRFAEVAGVSAEEFARRFQEDAAGAIVLFIDGLARMQKQGGDVTGALEGLGLAEIRVRDALLRASGAGDLFRTSMELGSKAWQENTALTKEAEERYKTTASKIEVAKSKFSDLGVELFEKFKPAINDTIDGFANLADSISGAMSASNSFGANYPQTVDTINASIPFLGQAIAAWNNLNAAMRGLPSEIDVAGALAPYSTRIRQRYSDAGVASGGPTGRLGGREAELEPAFGSSAAFSQYVDDLDQAESNAAQAKAALDALNASIRTGTMLAIDEYGQREANLAQGKAWTEAAEEQERQQKKLASAARGAAGESGREAERMADAWKDATRGIDQTIQDLEYTIAQAGERSGERWIEEWFRVDAAIRDTQMAAEQALSEMEQRDILDRSIRSRRDAFQSGMDAEELLYRRRRDDEENLWMLQFRLGRADTEEEKARLREQYEESLALLAHRRQREDEDREWAKAQAKRRQEFDDQLAREAMDRQRARIIEDRDARIAAINMEWERKQQQIEEEKAAAIKAAKETAAGRLEALQAGYFDKLGDAAGPGLERLAEVIKEKLGAIVMAEASGGGGGEYTDPSHQPGGDIFEQWKANEPAEYAAWLAAQSMDSGGIVAGPYGSHQLVLARGGETFGGWPPRGGAGTSIVVNIAGSVTTERDLVGAIYDGLRELSRRNGPLGFES